MSKIELDYKCKLIDILNKIEIEDYDFNWSLFTFEASIYGKSNYDVNKLSNDSENSINGYKISSKELIVLAKDIMQVDDLILVGYVNSVAEIEYQANDQWRYQQEIVIEVADSCAPWEIWTKNIHILNAFKKLNG